MNKFFNYILNLNKSLKALMLSFLDIFLIVTSTFLSLSIIESQIVPFSKSLILYCILVVIFYLPTSYMFNNYNSINRFFDLKNIINLLKASFITIFLLLLISKLAVFRFLFLENIIIQNIILFFFIINLRITMKLILNIDKKGDEKRLYKKKSIIYGAGETGSYIYENSSELSDYNIVCFVDDDLKKKGRYLKDLKIYHVTELQSLIKKHNIEKIFISILNLSTFDKQKIYENLNSLSIDYEYLGQETKKKDGLSKINFEKKDILNIANENLISELKGKTVMVTGAAGTIGEELCFQLIKHAKFLIAADKSELGVSNLKSKLAHIKKDNSKVYLTNLLDLNDIKSIVKDHKPDFIFHAAAYKHVEICEENPFHSSINNCLSIYNILLTAKEFGVPNFTFVSTDKAVNPVNIMGKTKQFGEFLVKYFAANEFLVKQNYISVRFGNVLNSSGSLIPKIRNQIENGNDVSITDKKATRYFMTISDAVSLVLESTFLRKNGKTFVLKMGKALNIYSLAVKLINDYKIVQNKNSDIKINIVGLRPGEKLHEELCHDGFREVTKNDHIFIDEKKFDLDIKLEEKIDELREICNKKNFIELNKFYSSLTDKNVK